MENYFKKLGILILTFSPILTFSKKITATTEKTLR